LKATLLEISDFNLDSAALAIELRLEANSEYSERLAELCRDAASAARPRALLRPADIEKKEEGRVTIEAIIFDSTVLRTNLEEAYRVYPFIATCGQEIEDWSNSLNTLLDRYWADVIKEKALYAAVDKVREHLALHYRLGKIAMMNPGSLEDWRLEEQEKLFRLLAPDLDWLGVTLTANHLMYPIKSVSGLCYPTAVDFENCQLCTRRDCPGRRVPLDPDLYERHFHRRP
jgi:hypothetical protein